jgi:hypothetical protein
MSGTSRGFIKMVAVGARVANAPTYFPAHSKNGVNVDQRIQVRCVVNVPGKANQGKGETIGLNIVGWGKLADVLARSCSNGKEMHLDIVPNVYKGQVFWKDPNGGKDTPAIAMTVNTPAGVVKLEVEKTSYKIKQIVFGSDSQSTIKTEEDAGFRPAGWHVAGSPAEIAYKANLKTRNEQQYDPAKAMFAFARVRKIEGPGIGVYDHTKTRSQAINTAAAIAAAVASTPVLPMIVPGVVPPPEAPTTHSTAVIAGL